MFSEAVKNIRPCVQSVITGTGPRFGGGHGVYVSDSIFLTARHIIKNQATIRICSHLGIHAAEVIWSSEPHDFAILRRGELVEPVHIDRPPPAPTSFPILTGDFPFDGTSVGYVATFSRKTDTGEQDPHTAFFASHVAFNEIRSPGRFFALVPSFVEPGFSGGPVFTADYKLVGVISHGVETLRVSPNYDLANFPKIAPIYPHYNRLNALLNNPTPATNS